jgi:hypothetical protein
MIIIQPNNMGTVNNNNSRLLPKIFARYPAGMAPVSAPRGVIDPIQEASSLVITWWKELLEEL